MKQINLPCDIDIGQKIYRIVDYRHLTWAIEEGLGLEIEEYEVCRLSYGRLYKNNPKIFLLIHCSIPNKNRFDDITIDINELGVMASFNKKEIKLLRDKIED